VGILRSYGRKFDLGGSTDSTSEIEFRHTAVQLYRTPAQRRSDFCCLGEPARLAGESAAAKSPLAIQLPNFRSIRSEHGSERVLRWLDYTMYSRTGGLGCEALGWPLSYGRTYDVLQLYSFIKLYRYELDVGT
jgi:hypothetical protein